MAKPINEIYLSHIVEATEGSLSLVECVDDHEFCSRYKECVTYDIWTQMRDALFQALDSITLKKMVTMHKQKCRCKTNQMYDI